jgi:MFS family permease
VNSLSSRAELRGSPPAPRTSEHEPGALRERIPTWALASALTAVLGLAYVIAAPPSTDLAAAAYRSDLFARVGFTLWDNSWYGGHHLPAYSLLAPALGAWLGPQLLNALAMVAATALFALLIDGCFPARATRIAAIWLALGASFALLANRVPYDLGLALGLGALLVLRGASERSQRSGRLARLGRRAAALALAVLCAVASPVAGAFLALAGLAWTLRSRGANGWPRGWPVVFTLAALVPIGLLTLVFPEGGTQPFVASAFYPDIAAILLIAALIVRAKRERTGNPGEGLDPAGADVRSEAVDRLLLAGTLLYALALLGSYAIPSAVGGNVDRLGALLAGPILACVLTARHPRLLLLLAPLFLYWQLNAPLTDFASAASDPAVNASYYTPLLGELRTLGIGYAARPARIEVVPSADHGEARWMAPHVMLARGWERQLDQQDGPLFYDEASTPLTPARYRAWLSEQAVSYVALPDAPLDYSAKGEAKLLRGGGPSYLREIWTSAHWRLFAVLGAAPLARAPAVLRSAGTDSFTLSEPRAANTIVRIRFTPYWAIVGGHGCVREAPGGWTEVQAQSAGSVRVGIDFSLERVFDHGPRCTPGGS